MPKYQYSGAVLDIYGRCLNDRWKAETIAPNLARAKSNFMYQFKTSTNKLPSTKITLTGQIKEVI